MDIVQLLDLKKKIEKLKNDIKDLIHNRDSKKGEAEQIRDKNSNFYKVSIKKANNIQKQINRLSEQSTKLREEFDEVLKREKERELKKLEEKKSKLDKVGIIRKQDKDVKIKELNEEEKRLLTSIKDKKRDIEEFNERIDKHHITNPKDVWMQSRAKSKEDYKSLKEELKKVKEDLKYLSIIDPRKEFIKTEEQILGINALNYNNLEEFMSKQNIESVNEQGSEDGNPDGNAAESDPDIQSMPDELNRFMKEIENSYLTKSLTDLQFIHHQSYTEAFKELESEVDEFFNKHKKLLEGKDIKDIGEIMPYMSNDAIMMLKSRIRREYRTNDNSIQGKKSFFSKIKSVFSKKDKKTSALTKQSKFRQLFNNIKNRFRRNENVTSYNATERTTTDTSEKRLSEKLIEEYGPVEARGAVESTGEINRSIEKCSDIEQEQ